MTKTMTEMTFGVSLVAAAWIVTISAGALQAPQTRAQEKAAAIVPRVELVATEVARAPRATVHVLRIANSHEFPIEELKAANPLPANPCKSSSAFTRLWLEIYRSDDSRAACIPLTKTTAAGFAFRDYLGTHPEIYVVLTDVKTGNSWKSALLRTRIK